MEETGKGSAEVTAVEEAELVAEEIWGSDRSLQDLEVWVVKTLEASEDLTAEKRSGGLCPWTGQSVDLGQSSRR